MARKRIKKEKSEYSIPREFDQSTKENFFRDNPELESVYIDNELRLIRHYFHDSYNPIKSAYNRLFDLLSFQRHNHPKVKQAITFQDSIGQLIISLREDFNFPYFWPRAPLKGSQWFTLIEPTLNNSELHQLSLRFRSILKMFDKIGKQYSWSAFDRRRNRVKIGNSIIAKLDLMVKKQQIRYLIDFLKIQSGISPNKSTIYRWINGDIQMALILTLRKLEKFFDADMEIIDGIAEFPFKNGKMTDRKDEWRNASPTLQKFHSQDVAEMSEEACQWIWLMDKKEAFLRPNKDKLEVANRKTERDDSMAESKMLPVLPLNIGLSDAKELDLDPFKYNTTTQRTSLVGNDPYAFAMLITDDWMSPAYKFGDLAIVSPSSKTSDGDVVIIGLWDGDVMFGEINLSNECRSVKNGIFVEFFKSAFSKLKRYNPPKNVPKITPLIASDLGRKSYGLLGEKQKKQYTDKCVKWMYPIVGMKKFRMHFQPKPGEE